MLNGQLDFQDCESVRVDHIRTFSSPFHSFDFIRVSQHNHDFLLSLSSAGFCIDYHFPNRQFNQSQI